jgi:hypothetical protein
MRIRSSSVVIVILLVALVAVFAWPGSSRVVAFARSGVYSLARERSRASYLASLADWHEVSNVHFIVKYQDADRQLASVVLAVAEENRQSVIDQLDYAPTEQTVIAVYPSREELQASFGWPASESAVGIYWGGAIRLLSPRVWSGADDIRSAAAAFRKSGPFVHEYTHLVLDYRTGGNYPRWFSEGLAQWYEYRVSGYIWNDPAGDLTDRKAADLYSLTELTDDFESLDNEALAYRQSLSLVTKLASVDHGQALSHLIERLAEQRPFALALADEFGQTPAQFEAQWLDWITAHPYPW